MAVWNLARFAETLLPLLSEREGESISQAEQALGEFHARYEAILHRGFRAKLGLLNEAEGDLDLANDLLDVMARGRADFTLTFRLLGDDLDIPGAQATARRLFEDPGPFDAWSMRWRNRLARDGGATSTRKAVMHGSNPKFIPRNHRVEAMIKAAVEDDDSESSSNCWKSCHGRSRNSPNCPITRTHLSRTRAFCRPSVARDIRHQHD